jgi:hypothetical protein
MIYLSAKHIAVKKDQDRSAYDFNKVVLCDGIGEFNDSAKAAEITVENILLAEKKNEIIGMINKSAVDISANGIIGGTTLIAAIIESNEDIRLLRLAYVGNGSVFHLHGNYFELPSSYGEANKPYRFSNIVIPHIDKDGVLLRHISHHSNSEELVPSFIEMSLTGINGDIVLLFSDGISTLEEDIIVIDDQQRIWRNQSESVSIILNDLHEWLEKNCNEMPQVKIDDFLDVQLSKLKTLNKLEDDASIGLVITDKVLEYYQQRYNATKNN